MTAGDMAFVLTSYFIMQGYLRDIGQHVRNLQRAANEMEEMVEFHAHPLGVADRSDAKPILLREGEILYDRVTFRYAAQEEPLFRDFSLRIDAGERVGLVGHSGSGTTGACAAGTDPVSSDAGENIAYGRPDASMTEIEKASQLANAHEFILRQPKGYHTLVGERGVKLSGGERQGVALARAFLADTPVLVLDEAT